MDNYCVFEYMYRDANNFKAFGQIFLSGTISEEYVSERKSYLDSGEYFVAEQVDIPTLYSQLWKYSNGPTSADHASHEFSLLRVATKEEALSHDVWGRTSLLLELFRRASHESWDYYLSVHAAWI